MRIFRIEVIPREGVERNPISAPINSDFLNPVIPREGVESSTIKSRAELTVYALL